jgi:hypothetical protein
MAGVVEMFIQKIGYESDFYGSLCDSPASITTEITLMIS